MWFIRAMAEFDNGEMIPVYADLSESYVHATLFFDYFSDAQIFDTYDLMWETEPQVTLEDILNAFSEKEKEEVNFSTA
jgi:hypothetical protein